MTERIHSATVSPHASAATEASTTRFVLPAERFALAGLFEHVPNARVECEPAIANPDDHALIVVRADGDEPSVDTALRADPDVATVECFGERSDGWAYRITWDGRPRKLIQRLDAAGITILSLRGQASRWKLRIVAPHREDITQMDEIMHDLGCEAECLRISSVSHNASRHSSMTDDQREALVEAFEMGYYDIPRDITTTDLAEELDISHQALSERFRRAHCQLVEETPVVGDISRR